MRVFNFNGIVGDSATRLVIGLISGTISIVLLMLILGIISIDELGKVLNLSASQMEVVRSVLSKIQVLVNHVLEILSKMLTKLLSWSGVEVDLSKIKVDMNGAGDAVSPATNVNPVESSTGFDDSGFDADSDSNSEQNSSESSED